MGARRLRRRAQVSLAARAHGARAVAVRGLCGGARVARPIGDAFPSWSTLSSAAAAGIGGCLGLGALYRGMAVGAMGIVAPTSALSAAIPFTVGIASGERPGVLQVVGIALALAGVALASREPAHRGGGRAAGVGLALVALGFGLYFVFLDRAAEESVPCRLRRARDDGCPRDRRSTRPRSIPPPGRGPPARAGLRRSLRRRGERPLRPRVDARLLSIVSVLAALYPVVTVALAALLLHERIAADSASASPAPRRAAHHAG